MAQFHTFTYALHDVAPYINWLYFFHAWGFPARLGSIAKVHGCEACRQNWLQAFSTEERPKAREAMKLYDEAQSLLQALDKRYHTYARIALLPAYSEGDNIMVKTYSTEKRIGKGKTSETETEIENGPETWKRKECSFDDTDTNTIAIPLLRQQSPGENGLCLCLSDFVKPKPQEGEEADALYNRIGLFACSVDKEMEEQNTQDEYLHLLHQILADRLAEATAEKVHEYVRTTLWGYAPNEHLMLEDLFCENYVGKRPAVGYPSLPDQSLNFVLDEILDFKSIGIRLTENGAMRPHASTSGLMLAHPATQHFSVGNIGKDQMEEYAQRRGLATDDISRFLK